MHCFETWRSDVIKSLWKLSGLKRYWYPKDHKDTPPDLSHYQNHGDMRQWMNFNLRFSHPGLLKKNDMQL